jgi:hypothetical protein
MIRLRGFGTFNITVSGTASEGGSLTASITSSTDPTAVASATFKWQENIGTAETPVWADLPEATSATLSIPNDQSYVGKQVRVVATISSNSLGSNTIFVIESHAKTITNIDDAATGSIIITGTPTEGGSLLADFGGVTDPDGGLATSIRWQKNFGTSELPVWVNLQNADGSTTLVIPDDQSYAGKEVRALIRTADVFGGYSEIPSTSQTITNLDDQAGGNVLLKGYAINGGLLYADVSAVKDDDGPLSSINYRWQENIGTTDYPIWNDLIDTNSRFLPLTHDRNLDGKHIRTVVETIDSFGGASSIISESTLIVLSNSILVDSASSDIQTSTENDNVTLSFISSGYPLTTVDGKDGLDIFDSTGISASGGYRDYTHEGIAGFRIGDYFVANFEVLLGNSQNDNTFLLQQINKSIVVHGGSGKDWFATSFAGQDVLFGYGGDDYFYVRPLDKAFGGDGNDTFNLYANSDHYSLSFVDGGNGTDTLELGFGWTIDLTLGNAISPFPYRDNGYEIDNIENVSVYAWSGYRSKVVGDTKSNLLYVSQIFGGIFDDGSSGVFFDGAQGDDELRGSKGKDQLFGGTGNDTITGGKGDDLIDGGAGRDTAIFNGKRSEYTVTLDTSTSTYTLSSVIDGADQVSGVETFVFANLVFDESQLFDSTAPTALDLSFLDNSSSGASFSITFSESIEAGSGQMVLRHVDGTIYETFQASNSRVVFSGNVVTIHPSVDLTIGTTYVLEIKEDSVRDIAGNSLVGLSYFRFSTATDTPTGFGTFNITVSGTASEGGSLTASITSSTDPTAVASATFKWQENIGTAETPVWADLPEATSATLSIPNDQSYVGKQVRVVATISSNSLGSNSSSESAARIVQNVNDAPTGSLLIEGEVTQGQQLSASHSLEDGDGIPHSGPYALAYQWLADGQVISGATGSTLELGQAQVGKAISVKVSYTDNGGTTETVISATTPVVAAETFPLQGIAYHWKSHSLLSAVNASVVQNSAVKANSEQLLDLRAAKFDAATNKLSVEVWANSGSSSLSFDFKTSVSGAIRTNFTSELPTDWIVITAESNVENVAVGGISLVGLSGSFKLGTLQVSLPEGGTFTEIAFSQIQVGSTLGADQGLTMQTSFTGADGTFKFTSRTTEALQLTASRAAHDSGNAVTSADALAALRIAVGLNPNPVTASGQLKISPYQIMAADVNGDGKVTSADALAILRMAVRLSTAPPQEWFFVEEKRDFWDEAAQKFTLTRTSATWDRSVTTDTASDRVNLVGILKGDVNGSWAPPSNSQDLDAIAPQYFQNLATLIGVPTDQWGVLPPPGP